MYCALSTFLCNFQSLLVYLKDSLHYLKTFIAAVILAVSRTAKAIGWMNKLIVSIIMSIGIKEIPRSGGTRL